MLTALLDLQAYDSATADKRTTSQKSWDKAQVRCSLVPLLQRLQDTCHPMPAIAIDLLARFV